MTVIFLLIGIVGCEKEKETIIEAPKEDSLIDPAVIPRVLFTYPPNGGQGPFNVYVPPFFGCYWECNPCDCDQASHFILQFNKLMLLSTFNSSSVRCTGFKRGVRVSASYQGSYLPPASNIIQFWIDDSVSIYQYSPRSVYQVGQTYTVSFDTSIMDVNDNHPAAPFSFSFTPEPYLRILKTFPSRGDSISELNFVKIQFNSFIDTSIFASIHLDPPVGGRWQINYTDSMSAIFVPATRLGVGLDYTMTIDQGARDKYGNTLRAAFHSPFRTYSFRVDYTNPKDKDTVQYLSGGINIAFTGPVSAPSVSPSISITPYFPGEFNGYSGYVSIYSRDHDLLPNTTYNVVISTTLRSADGVYLSSPYAYSFVTRPFQILNTNPSDGENYVGRADRIFVQCNGRMDTTTIRPSFSVLPRVVGHFVVQYYGDLSFIFSPDSLYAPDTKYRVIVSTSLRSIDGYSIAQPDTFSFTTVP